MNSQVSDDPSSATSLAGRSSLEILCRRLSGDRNTRTIAMQTLTDDVTRGAVLDLAKHEKLLPAVYEAVTEYPDVLPKSDRIRLAVEYERQRRRNLRIRNAALELAAEADRRSIQMVFLKGAMWLIEDTSGASAWRHMGDIDILVRERDYKSMRSVLAELRYRPYKSERTFLGRERYRWDHHMVPHGREGEPFLVEVHRHIDWRRDLLPPELFFSNLHHVSADLNVPAPWLAALYSIVHWQDHHFGLQRGLNNVRYGVEIAQFLRRADVDWALVVQFAQVYSVQRELENALAVAAALFGMHVPEPARLTARGSAYAADVLLMRRSRTAALKGEMLFRALQLWDAHPSAYRMAVRKVDRRLQPIGIWGARLREAPALVRFWLSYLALAAALNVSRALRGTPS